MLDMGILEAHTMQQHGSTQESPTSMHGFSLEMSSYGLTQLIRYVPQSYKMVT